MTYEDDFHAYIMECVDFTLPNDILFSVDRQIYVKYIYSLARCQAIFLHKIFGWGQKE